MSIEREILNILDEASPSALSVQRLLEQVDNELDDITVSVMSPDKARAGRLRAYWDKLTAKLQTAI